jgi:hypothetical protein
MKHFMMVAVLAVAFTAACLWFLLRENHIPRRDEGMRRRGNFVGSNEASSSLKTLASSQAGPFLRDLVLLPGPGIGYWVGARP